MSGLARALRGFNLLVLVGVLVVVLAMLAGVFPARGTRADAFAYVVVWGLLAGSPLVGVAGLVVQRRARLRYATAIHAVALVLSGLALFFMTFMVY
jgi:hypothetical protein